MGSLFNSFKSLLEKASNPVRGGIKKFSDMIISFLPEPIQNSINIAFNAAEEEDEYFTAEEGEEGARPKSKPQSGKKETLSGGRDYEKEGARPKSKPQSGKRETLSGGRDYEKEGARPKSKPQLGKKETSSEEREGAKPKTKNEGNNVEEGAKSKTKRKRTTALRIFPIRPPEPEAYLQNIAERNENIIRIRRDLNNDLTETIYNELEPHIEMGSRIVFSFAASVHRGNGEIAYHAHTFRSGGTFTSLSEIKNYIEQCEGERLSLEGIAWSRAYLPAEKKIHKSGVNEGWVEFIEVKIKVIHTRQPLIGCGRLPDELRKKDVFIRWMIKMIIYVYGGV